MRSIALATVLAACQGTPPVEPAGPADGSTGLPARNLIFLMGDGMGPEQLATGRFVAGRLRTDALRGPSLANTDSLTTLETEPPEATDSAAGATVLATGVVVRNGVVSQGPDGEPLETVLEVYARAGCATGLVTTSYFYDASPAAFAAHATHRYEDAPDIVRQILGVTRPEVVMGHPGYDVDPALLDAAAGDAYVKVRSARELEAWDPAAGARLLGLFETDYVAVDGATDAFSMTPELVRTPASPDPPLARMTERALARLSRADCFFLFVEDEIMDQLGHGASGDRAWINQAYPPQALGFDRAVGVAIDWVLRKSSFDETLIVVTADHETGGYEFDHSLGAASGELVWGGPPHPHPRGGEGSGAGQRGHRPGQVPRRHPRLDARPPAVNRREWHSTPFAANTPPPAPCAPRSCVRTPRRARLLERVSTGT